MRNQSIYPKPRFLNQVIDKKQFVQLIIWAFSIYGTARAANMADQLKDLGFYYATKAGISLSIEDLRIPPMKKTLLNKTLASIKNTDVQYIRGEITAVERFQKVIDIWHNTNETLTQEVIKYFKKTDPLNSIYMMSFSGARGNISQVRQLVGMRGLMADPHGQIIDLPIVSNFREGLTVTEYFISSYGARKGLVDTALRTADSGYLTRRLVDVAQDIIIRQVDCKTTRGILLEDLVDNQKILMPLEQALLGRVLAENIYNPHTGTLIAYANQDISSEQANRIVNVGIKKVLVRSPLTCNSSSAVCQRCYGWNLSHRQLVDTGEAVGIIAAQSIGEPGTQLTMRTFHTGGVFTGELAQKIYSPVDGIIKYPSSMNYRNVRNRHGDTTFFVQKDCTISIESDKKKNVTIDLRKGTSLLVRHNSFVTQQQIIAEEPVSKQLMTEEAEKQVIADLSGKAYFANLTVQETNNNQYIARSTKQGGLVWILSGQVYNVPDNATIIVQKYLNIHRNASLAQLTITNKHSGRVKINLGKNDFTLSTQVQIITDEITLPNSKVYLGRREFQDLYILETNIGEKFILQVTPGEKVTNEQIIASLASNTYKTSTGGILKYLDLSIVQQQNKSVKNSYEISGSGYILWIPEETHEINKDISALLVKHGDIIEAGTEILRNTFSKNSGIVEIIKKDGIVKEIIIKPGVLYHCPNTHYIHSKYREFLRPGEKIIENQYTNKLVYCEYIEKSNSIYKLVRPVTIYSVPRKHYSCESSQTNNNLYIKVIKKVNFRDGERVKSVNGVNLVTTHIVVYIKHKHANLHTTLECSRLHESSNEFQIKLSTAEILSIKKHNFDNMYQSTKLLVQHNQNIKANTTIVQTEILSHTAGQIADISDKNNFGRRILVFSDADRHIIHIKNKHRVSVKEHQWIYAGDNICTNTASKYSGQVTKINKDTVIIHIARPYLLSHEADLHVNNNDLVQQGEKIATLKFQRSKTKDIVQGLPKIEEILEARKKLDAAFKPHIVLNDCFKKYLKSGLKLKDATRLSFQKIQLHLVKEIQLVYQSQKVDISDKHVEVIIKQMTSKVKIERGGNTGQLPGEIISLEKIEKLNHVMSNMNKQTAIYYPILLGITKASLNTESFISAASFQETTRVLTEAAISGKLDWLKGLKENVIIGRLIPAGTGFNAYKNPDFHMDPNQDYNIITDIDKISSQDLDDIILDDRAARSYHISD